MYNHNVLPWNSAPSPCSFLQNNKIHTLPPPPLSKHSLKHQKNQHTTTPQQTTKQYNKQAQTREGEWIFVDPVPGAFAINIGDMLARW